jgi:hypothetical protein
MALDKKLISIPFSSGADTKTSDIIMEPGQLEVLENAVFEKTGRIEKRKGCSTSDWTGGSANNPVGTYVYRDNLIIEGDETLFNLLGTDGNANHVTMGLNAFFESELFPAGTSVGHHQLQPSVAVSHSGDYVAVAYIQATYNNSTSAVNYAPMVSILDAKTGTVVLPNRQLADGDQATWVGAIKVVAHGTDDAADDGFAVYYEHNNSGAISLMKGTLNYSSFTPTVSTVVDSSTYRQTAAETSFDVFEHTPGAGNYQKVHVVFTEYTGSTHKVSYKLDDNGSFSGAVSHNQTGAISHITAYRSSAGGTARVYFGFNVGTAKHVRTHVESDQSSATTATDSLGSAINVSGHWCDSEDGNKVEYHCTTGSDTSTYTSMYNRYQVTPATGALDVDETPIRLNVWMPMGPIKTSAGVISFQSNETRNDDADATSLHTVSAWIGILDNPTSIIPSLYRSIIGSCLRQSLLRPHINGTSCRVVSDGTSYFSALPKTTAIQTYVDGSGNVSTAINSMMQLVKMSVSRPAYEVPRAQLGGQLFFSSGCIKSTSGAFVGEHGFFYKPSITIAESSAGSLTSSGVYKYRAVWEWEDQAGNLHRSEPSDPETVTLTSTNTGVDITADQISVTLKRFQTGQLNLVIYRTQNGGNIYNKVATIGTVDLDGSVVVTPRLSHTDKVSDASAATGAFLYTEGGELANVPTPAAWYIATHRNRLFMISEDHQVWYSKEYEEAIGLGLSDEFRLPMDGMEHDKPTALCSSGEELYIFRENSTWSISGEGPSKTGVGEFYKPRQISATVGALKGSPTIYTDSGVYFQNIKGIFRIGQQGIEYIGAPVEGILGSSRVIAIRHHQATETIRFALSDKVLAYNYRYNAWSNYTYSLGGGETIVGMENMDDVIYVVTSADKILKEDTSYKVGTNYIVLKMRTGWISFNQIQGFGRAYRFALLGESRDKHTLTVKVYYDYDDSASVDTYTFTTSSATDAVLQFRAHLSKQKCQAVKFEIYDADNSASVGDGFAIDQITIEVGTKKGIFRTAQSTNTIGAS